MHFFVNLVSCYTMINMIESNYPKSMPVTTKKIEVKKENPNELYIKEKSLIISTEYNIPENLSRRIVQAVVNTCNYLRKEMDLNVYPYEILAIIETESSFNYKCHAHSTNAKGLMQITPICYKSVKKRLGNKVKNDLFNIENNILVGTYYYAYNKNRTNTDYALVSYNMGYKNIRSNVNVSRGMDNSYLNKVKRRFYKYK